MQWKETLAYFDGINFADKITCPIIVSIGLQDNVCPPETGYAMFNCISSQDKRLYAYDGHGHDANQHVHAGVINSFFDKHLKGQGCLFINLRCVGMVWARLCAGIAYDPLGHV